MCKEYFATSFQTKMSGLTFIQDDSLFGGGLCTRPVLFLTRQCIGATTRHMLGMVNGSGNLEVDILVYILHCQFRTLR